MKKEPVYAELNPNLRLIYVNLSDFTRLHFDFVSKCSIVKMKDHLSEQDVYVKMNQSTKYRYSISPDKLTLMTCRFAYYGDRKEIFNYLNYCGEKHKAQLKESHPEIFI
ncbi:hypothetical protein WCWAEYFT_CDS0282 [Vibrio phage VB_VaC_TDDLMA]